MLRAETELRVGLNVGCEGVGINDFVRTIFEQRDELCGAVVDELLWQVQEAWLSQVLGGDDELTCTRCGVIHTGPGSVLRSSASRSARSWRTARRCPQAIGRRART